ncbi:MAG TPA: hypothetical protein VFW11_14825 [Cyclobacteriaceae bacterium]|nr:hypothetical protein [Cyclobacteriaceae bacterium]
MTDTDRPRKYWNNLKTKLKKERSELSENIGQLKIESSEGDESKIIAQQGGTIAGNTRKQIEAKTGKKIVSKLNAKSIAEGKPKRKKL